MHVNDHCIRLLCVKHAREHDGNEDNCLLGVIVRLGSALAMLPEPQRTMAKKDGSETATLSCSR